VYILRWYWWRVNAWSEISAMIAALVVSLSITWSGVFDASPLGFAQTLLVTVASTTLVWLVATFMTAPEPPAVLDAFYRRVTPAGPGWAEASRRTGIISRDPIAPNFVNWLLGMVLVYAVLYGLGQIFFGSLGVALVSFAIGLAAGYGISRNLARSGWQGE
jgi:hypothetical protein